MNQFDQYVLASSLIAEGSLFRESKVMRAVSAVAAVAVVILAGGLLVMVAAVSAMDRPLEGEASSARPVWPADEPVHAVAPIPQVAASY